MFLTVPKSVKEITPEFEIETNAPNLVTLEPVTLLITFEISNRVKVQNSEALEATRCEMLKLIALY